jgi:hypothetical protein
MPKLTALHLKMGAIESQAAELVTNLWKILGVIQKIRYPKF